MILQKIREMFLNTKKFLYFAFLIFLSFSLFSQESSLKESVDSENKLRLMTFEDEYFIPEKKDGESVLINKAGKSASRSFYDEANRIIKKEIWQISDARNSRLSEVEIYEYEDSSDNVSKKTYKTDMSEEITFYNKNGFPVLSELYFFKESEQKGKEEPEKIKYLFSKRSLSYDSENRVLKEEVTQDKKTELKIISYHEDKDIPPDFECYENETLKKKVIYSSVSTYVEELFFDSSYSVKSYFNDGRRKKDEYFQNGKLIRTKKYE